MKCEEGITLGGECVVGLNGASAWIRIKLAKNYTQWSLFISKNFPFKLEVLEKEFLYIDIIFFCYILLS